MSSKNKALSANGMAGGGGGKTNNVNNGNNEKGKNNVPQKSKKQSDADEFEQVLADLNRVTAAVGKQRTKQQEREDKLRKEKQAVVPGGVRKAKGIDDEFATMLRKKQQRQQFQQFLQQLLAAQSPFLEAPATEVNCEVSDTNPHFNVAVAEMQGWRVSMEDKHVLDVTFPSGANNSEEGLFCVFDGHSGKDCAIRCSELIPKVSRNHLKRHVDGFSEIDFEAVYLEVDALLEGGLSDQSGCTAVSVHVTPTRITCASVGDSRAVLCRNGAAVALSEDHKPERAEERARIEAAGGIVSENRVNGQLAMSRAFGDFSYKAQKTQSPREQLVITVPDVVKVDREIGDTFLVLACDGIFDVLSNEQLINSVLAKKGENKPNRDICEEICRECLAPSAEGGRFAARPQGTDNMTLMIVDLK